MPTDRQTDIRDFRYRITTPSGDIRELSGKRTYFYLCAAAEANGEYVHQARESAAETMRTALQTPCNLLTDPLPDLAYRIEAIR